LFKAPEIFTKMRYANRDAEQFRFIPGKAAEDFVLAPTMKSIDQFIEMAGGIALPLGTD
jgi:hypothetical protein